MTTPNELRRVAAGLARTTRAHRRRLRRLAQALLVIQGRPGPRAAAGAGGQADAPAAGTEPGMSEGGRRRGDG